MSGINHMACCCACEECVVSDFGVNIGFGWTVEPKICTAGKYIQGTFKYEATTLCGGTNDGAQTGQAICTLVLSSAQTVTYRVWGTMEPVITGDYFPQVEVYRDATKKLDIGSTFAVCDELNCGTEAVDEQVSEVLSAGTYSIEIYMEHAGYTPCDLEDWKMPELTLNVKVSWVPFP